MLSKSFINPPPEAVCLYSNTATFRMMNLGSSPFAYGTLLNTSMLFSDIIDNDASPSAIISSSLTVMFNFLYSVEKNFKKSSIFFSGISNTQAVL